jgi:acetyl-CoA C-acetyltransferase
MDKNVAIVGYRIQSAPDLVTSRERLTFELTRGLFDDLGIERTDVDTTIIDSNDFMDGRTISNVFLDPPAGVYMRDESKVEMDATNAVIYACMRILSGQYKTALVVSLALTGFQVSPYLYIEYTLNPTYERQMNLLNEINAAAFQAHSYLGKFGYSEALLDSISAQALANAALNPNQSRRISGIDKGRVAASPMYYEPLRELHCYPPTDGGCAVLLASEEKAKDLTDKPVWIKGLGMSTETYYLGERKLYTSRSAAEAAQRAYELAGVKKPQKDIDLAEISALFAHQEPLLAEALGLLDEGKADKAYADGKTAISGELPLNPSGGALGGHPVSVTGMMRMVEAARQLRGEAGDNQVEKAELAVVHGQDGVCAQQNAVLVLGI